MANELKKTIESLKEGLLSKVTSQRDQLKKESDKLKEKVERKK